MVFTNTSCNYYCLIKGFKELPANGVLLMYVSADGCFQTSKHVNDRKYII